MSEVPRKLLRVNEATDLLGIERSQLQNMFPHLHILEMPRGSRRFPVAYIREVGAHITGSHYARRVYAAHEFSRSDLAQRLIEAAEIDLDETISTHAVPLTDDGFDTYVSAQNVADILHLGRMSVNDWHKAGAYELHFYNRVAYVAEFALRDVLQWQRPRFAEPDLS